MLSSYGWCALLLSPAESSEKAEQQGGESNSTQGSYKLIDSRQHSEKQKEGKAFHKRS